MNDEQDIRPVCHDRDAESLYSQSHPLELSSNKGQYPEIVLTRVKKTGGPLTKRIFLQEDGSIKSDSAACWMANGDAHRTRLENGPASLAALISGLGRNEALVLGDIADPERDQLEIARDKDADGFSTFGRTRTNFLYRPRQPALMLLDVDTAPPEAQARIDAEGGILPVLGKVIGRFDRYARVTRASTSAGLRNSQTGEEYRGSNGRHIYLMVTDGADIERATKVLLDRLWLAGFGWIKVSKVGSLLKRGPIDVAVHSAERLVFEGPPCLDPPLQQDAQARDPSPHDGALINTREALPDLTIEECQRLEELERKARAAAQPDAEKAAEAAAERVAERDGISIEAARQSVAATAKGEITSSAVVPFDDGDDVPVHVILADPDRFHGRTCADPIEGREGGRCKGKLYCRNDNCIPTIHSFSHGGRNYELKHDKDFIESRIEAGGEDAAYVCAKLLAQGHNLDPIAFDRIVKLAATIAKATIKSVRAVIKKAKTASRCGAQGRSIQDAWAGNHALESGSSSLNWGSDGSNQGSGGEGDGIFELDLGLSANRAPKRNWKTELRNAIARMNARYGVINLSGKTVVVAEAPEDALGRRTTCFMRRRDFEDLYCNESYQVGFDKHGYPRFKGLGAAWFEDASRKTYRKMDMICHGDCPRDVFNQYRGLGVEADSVPRRGVGAPSLGEVRA